jgi:2-oxo-4-hydroxy-4-carboxy-5-ureidoimidazoline decarboxylase
MTIAEFDHLDKETKRKLLYECCGSTAWVEKMLTIPPAEDLIDLFEDAEEKWYECKKEDWKEAFSHHSIIGDPSHLMTREEQSSIKGASEQVMKSLANGNKAYFDRFGYNFIVEAAGKSAVEMLGMLTARLNNAPEEEIKIAMEEHNKITRLRLEKLFET